VPARLSGHQFLFVRPTLILPVASLHLLVLALLDFTLEHTRSLRLIESSDLEDLGRVEIRVGSPSHYRNISTYHLVHGTANQEVNRTSLLVDGTHTPLITSGTKTKRVSIGVAHGAIIRQRHVGLTCTWPKQQEKDRISLNGVSPPILPLSTHFEDSIRSTVPTGSYRFLPHPVWVPGGCSDSLGLLLAMTSPRV